MTRRELAIINELRNKFNSTDRRQAREEAWGDLQDFAVLHGYGSRFCSLDSAMQWLMSSADIDVRNKALKLYGTYCATRANLDAADYIGGVLANIGV